MTLPEWTDPNTVLKPLTLDDIRKPGDVLWEGGSKWRPISSSGIGVTYRAFISNIALFDRRNYHRPVPRPPAQLDLFPEGAVYAK